MKRLLSVLMLAMVMTVGLAACSSTPRATPAERLAFYEAHAGEPVRSFRLFGRLNGWTSLGNNALVVWTRPNEAFLLDLTPCQDLQSALSITISNFANTVTAGFDTVTPHVHGLRVPSIPCRITQIRPIDTKALNQSREEIRQANAEARSDPPPSE